MLQRLAAGERGHFDHGWLETWHSFSFGQYFNPQRMGFFALRVINDDLFYPASGFPIHPHQDMEIITYILSGQLAHQDSTGGGGVIGPGQVQFMRAGSGIRHSEHNPSQDEPVHLLQIWLEPDQAGLPPGYETRGFNVRQNPGRWVAIAHPQGRDGAFAIRSAAALYAAYLEPGQSLALEPEKGKAAWVQVALGQLRLEGKALEKEGWGAQTVLAQGDALQAAASGPLALTANEPTELLWFDLDVPGQD